MWLRSCARAHEPLAKHTSFRIGGPAEWFAEPSTLDELIGFLRRAFQHGVPISVIGGGTNTLAADRGVCGIVLHLGRGFKTIQEIGDADEPIARIRCGSALLTQRLVSLAALRGWSQAELFAGLPGQIGGALAMNAQGICRFVQELTHVSFDGTVRKVTRDQLQFGYRYTALCPGIVVDAVFEFSKAPPGEVSRRIRQVLSLRNKTQELSLPSAGCAFKNPHQAPAGMLIDKAALKGDRIGDAQISSRHANFIVNLGHATCDDVLSLMEHVQRRVRQIFNIILEPEIRLIGERLN